MAEGYNKVSDAYPAVKADLLPYFVLIGSFHALSARMASQNHWLSLAQSHILAQLVADKKEAPQAGALIYLQLRCRAVARGT